MLYTNIGSKKLYIFFLSEYFQPVCLPVESGYIGFAHYGPGCLGSGDLATSTVPAAKCVSKSNFRNEGCLCQWPATVERGGHTPAVSPGGIFTTSPTQGNRSLEL